MWQPTALQPNPTQPNALLQATREMGVDVKVLHSDKKERRGEGRRYMGGVHAP